MDANLSVAGVGSIFLLFVLPVLKLCSCLIPLFMLKKKHPPAKIFCTLFASLTIVALSLLIDFYLFSLFAHYEDWQVMKENVPWTTKLNTVYVVLVVLANGLMVFKQTRKP